MPEGYTFIDEEPESGEGYTFIDDEPETPAGSALDYVVEPLQAIAGGAANLARSGYSGLGELATTGNPMAAARAVEASQAALPDFAPETQSGQRGLQTVGDLMKLGIDIVNYPLSGLAGLAELVTGGGLSRAVGTAESIRERGLGETLGERTLEETGSPLAATAAYMAPELAEAVIGGGAAAKGARAAQRAAREASGAIPRRGPPALVDAQGMPTGAFDRALRKLGLSYAEVADEIPRLPENIRPRKAAQEIVRRKIQAGGTEGGIAAKMLDDAGNVIDDDLAAEAIRTGFRPEDVQAVKPVSNQTREGMLKMLRDRARIQTNSKLEQTISPYNVVGDSAMRRVNFIRDATTDARNRLDDIVDTQLTRTIINPQPVAFRVFEELRDLKIKFDESTSPPGIDFAGSLIEKDKSAQRLVKDTLDLLSGDGPVTARRAHDVKRQLDNLIDFQKKGKRGLTEAGRRFAKAVRHEINQAIRAVSDEYGAVNDIMSTGIGTLDDLNKAMGTTIDIFERGANRAVGRTLRGLLSNIRSRTRMENAVLDIDDVAAEFGGVFNDDVTDLVQFANTLEERFGSTARQSFSGGIDKSVKLGLRGAGWREMAAEKLVDVVEGVMSKTDEDAYRAMERLLRRDFTPESQSRAVSTTVRKQ